jgi:hypothetical protein
MSVRYTDEMETAYDMNVSPYRVIEGSGIRGVEIACIRADVWENNDVREAASDISSHFSSNGTSLASATLLPAGDDDWYKLPNTRLHFPYMTGTPKFTLSSGASPIFIDVYRDGEVVATSVKSYALTADDEAAPHDWEIRVHGAVAAPYYLGANPS